MIRITSTVQNWKREEVIRYIEGCYLEDGGYFFARIPPSSGTDTYYAVQSLKILGQKPKHPEKIINFFYNQIHKDYLVGITGIFATVAVLNELGGLTAPIIEYVTKKLMTFRNEEGGFGAYKNLDVETTSELEGTYRAVWVLAKIKANYDKQSVINFVSGFFNKDGGYGINRHSTLASTFYATSIFTLLGQEIKELSKIKSYLRNQENKWHFQFIEELFWLITALRNVNEIPILPDKIVNFVMQCQRLNGGFSRSPIIGIPTLEYTYYALSIFKEIGFIQ